MKNEKGITLVSLVMTIILIMILAAIGTYTGFESYENMRVQAFVAKMITVQDAVDKLCDEYSISDINNMGTNFTSVASSVDKSVLTTLTSDKASLGYTLNCWYSAAGDDGTGNYRYFSTNDIATILGIKDFDTPIFFNPRTRNVIATKGIKYDGHTYYRQYDLSSSQELPVPNTDTDFTLNVSVKTFDNKAVIYVNTDKSITELRYYMKNDAGDYGSVMVSRDLDKITITESGIYKVEADTKSSKDENDGGTYEFLSDGIVTKSQENIKIAIVNKPMLVGGMTPVKYGGAGGTTLETTTSDDEDWYNYGEKRWANAMLNDKSSATATDGSLYVWIPRYAYKLNTDSNPISIEFLKGTSSVITTSGNSLGSSYKVIPAFEDGSTTGFTNGEWDSEIYGFWVAKYESTQQSITVSGTPTNFPKNRSVHQVSWVSISPINAFEICRKMETVTSTYFSSLVAGASGTLSYGVFPTDNNNIDTHLMKNSEWGAVAYLTFSEYGRGAEMPSKAGNHYIDTYAGAAYSTTNNAYGVLGFAGGALDMVAAGKQIKNDTFAYTSDGKSTKYATDYSTNATSIYGDAMTDTAGWKGCNNPTDYPQNICRGGDNSASDGGLFAYQNKNFDASELVTFRPVLIVEY